MSNGQPHRLLFLSTNLGIGGGAEEQVISLALSTQARGWDVRIVSMLDPSELPPEIRAGGVTVTSLGMRRGVPSPAAIARLAGLLRRFDPDIVHCHMTHANLLGRTARALHPVPVLISTLHGMRMYGVNSRTTAFRELAHRITDRWSDLTTTVCRAAAQYAVECRSVPAHKIGVVYNGIDTSRYAPDPDARIRLRQALAVDRRFVWLAVGRLEKPKAYDNMIRAFAQSAAGDPGSVLVICGAGSLEERMRQLAADLRVSGQISFLGMRRDVPQLMAAADGFLLSSETEGLPMVLLQASSAALPIIATGVGGVAEIVTEGKSGFLVPPNDSEALAAAMRRLTSMPLDRRRTMGWSGRERAQADFDTARITVRWEHIYRCLFAASLSNARKDQYDDIYLQPRPFESERR